MIRKVTKLIEEFKIEEQPFETLVSSNVDVLRGVVVRVDSQRKVFLGAHQR